MKSSYGAISATKPEGMLRSFRINNLVRLDEKTGDARLLKSDGANVRSLPRTVFGGFAEGDGHGDNVVIGRLDAVEFDPENNTATGWGWLLDDDNGRQAARYISTGAMTGNSIHMAEVEVSLEWGSDDPNDDDFWDYTLTFEKWSVASTTMLGIPAFKESQFQLDDELLASIYASEDALAIDGGFTVSWDVNMPSDELVADGGPRPAREHFFVPEAQRPTPITVGDMDEHGFYPVSGHLAQWNVCHDGILARCVTCPRPTDAYASFNASTVLTDKGSVQTGPIFFKGGHPSAPIGDRDAHQAYGGVENAWADVRIVEGVHGPWISGVVRPSVTDDVVYVARASRISGHWARDGRLKAIVSCNVPGFDVPGRGEARLVTDAEGNVVELVASFVGDCAPPAADLPVHPGMRLYGVSIDDAIGNSNIQLAFSRPSAATWMRFFETDSGQAAVQEATMGPVDDARERALALLQLEEEDDAV